MAIPDYQSLMLPVLKISSLGEARISDVVDRLADELQMSDAERSELLPSGKQTTFANRVHWAKTYLKQAGLVESTKRAHFRISKRGTEVLASDIKRIDVNFLNRYSEFRAFKIRANDAVEIEVEKPSIQEQVTPGGQTPDDQIRSAARLIHEALGYEIIERILVSSPSFFERVIISLLLAMGYGGTVAEAGRAIGRSGDDGIDGIVDQDTLGLDRVYVQAKRYKSDSAIGPSAIRDFFGSLDMHKATKGLFVTTSSFSKSAAETAERLGRRIVLIDGAALAKLMIRFNVGCRTEETVEIKKLDEEFFE